MANSCPDRSVRWGRLPKGGWTRGLVGLALAAACGCGGLPSRDAPPRVKAETAQQRFKAPDAAMSQMGYRRDWSGFAEASRGGRFLYADCYDDLVVVQDSSSTVSAIATGTGERRWSSTLANPLTNFVGNVRLGDEVWCSSESEVFALKLATGQLVGRQDLAKAVSTHPVLVGGTLVYGTPNGQLLAHYLGANVTLWGNTTEGAVTRNLVEMGNAIGAVTDAGHLIFVDKNTGTLLGRAQIYDGADCNPASSESLMFVASRDHSLYAFAPGLPKPVWRKRTGSPLKWSPVYHNGTVWCALPEAGLTAFYADSGSERWSSKDVDGVVVGTRAGKLLVWNGRRAFLLDPERGDVYQAADLPGVNLLVTDKFDDGNLYAISDLGVVVRFIPAS